MFISDRLAVHLYIMEYWAPEHIRLKGLPTSPSVYIRLYKDNKTVSISVIK